MPDFLLELLSEEIPARMQVQAAKDLERLIVGALSDRGLLFEAAQGFSGPRRLTLAITGLPVKQPDVREEKKGPRVNAPEKAIEGFLRSAGVSLAQCEKRDDGKGEFYVAVIARKGRPTAEVLAEILPELLAKLPWPKSMRFPGSPVRWVRPLHSILATFDGEVVPFEFAGVQSGSITRGHRFLSQGEIFARRFEDYEAALKSGHVILDPVERREIILHEAKQKAFALGLELIPDEGLLNEVAGLAEWPVVLIGTIEDQFMDVPPEILQTSMRTHQKYFSLHDPKTGKMANRFAVVANMIAEDGGKEIVAGNERVLRARLSDAKFFWDQDRKRPLESRVEDLKKIVFHAKLGTQYERVERIASLVDDIAQQMGGSTRAARLCKADLTTGLVGEFPELQGVMGYYYALHDGENLGDALAIRDHYKPLGPSDGLPEGTAAVTLALADKLDMLACFFAIGEKPTGSSDPFGLRRAALGVIRIVRNEARSHEVSLNRMILAANRGALKFATKYSSPSDRPNAKGSLHEFGLYGFFVDRLKVVLREEGVRHDLIDAVFSNDKDLDFIELIYRSDRLSSLIRTNEGKDLIAGYKRAYKLLKDEEKKEQREFNGAIVRHLLGASQERSLVEALSNTRDVVREMLYQNRYFEAVDALSLLRGPIDAFFEAVRVNSDDPALRENRLKILSEIVGVMHELADFSKVEG